MTTMTEAKKAYEAARDALAKREAMGSKKFGPEYLALRKAYTAAVKALLVVARAAAAAGTLSASDETWIAEESESDLALSASVDAWA